MHCVYSRLLRSTILLSAILYCSGAAQAERYRVFVGTYTGGDSISKGVYSCEFDAETGKLSEPVLAAELINPSFLAIHPSGKYLYAVNEVSEGPGRGNGAVTALTINADGTLTKINHQASEGGAPCHCNVDSTGTNLLIANYGGGNVAVYPISEDGSLKPVSCNIQHEGSSVDKSRQGAPHAHSINISSDNKFAYAADLGLDKIMIYKLDAEAHTLTPASQPAALVTPGGGPRHFAIHPSSKFAYTNNEITMVVTGFSRNPEDGSLKAIQEISTIPAGFDGRKSTAECLVHPSGKFLYVSNRGHETITAFMIDQETGLLTYVENEPTGGKEPRNFFIDPSGKWLLAENQNSDTVYVFSIDQQTGALKPTGDFVTVGRPVCIRMVKL
ncbi:MAG: lactonase family protein [Planctomycetota bacterium]|nr:MAG: lactonase family protein [Planctomycetota bacterium]